MKHANSHQYKKRIVKLGYVPYIPHKRKRGRKKASSYQKRNSLSRNKPWVVERPNSLHNRFRNLFARYEKKVENYLGLV
jgi:hypothetical protein